jgi:autotransporter translocation and assembly factor TamB
MVRRLVHALVIVLTLIVGAAAAAVIVSQTAWFKNWIRAYVVREANLYLNGTLSIERLSGNLLFGLEMENIGVSMDGRQVVSVKDMGLDYNIWDFVTKGLSVDNIRLDKPVIYLSRDGDAWTLSRLIKKEVWEADRSGPGRPVSIESVGVSDGSFVIDGPVGTSGVDVPRRFDHVDAKLKFKYEPVHYTIEIAHVSFRGSDPAIALNALSGGIAVRDDAVYFEKLAVRTAETSVLVEGAVQQYLTKPVYKLRISSDKLSVPELAHVLPALAGVHLQPQIEAKIDGPADHLGLEVNANESAGRVSASIVADVQSPTKAIAGTVSVAHLDLAPILDDRSKQSDISADGNVDLRTTDMSDPRAWRGTIALDAKRIAAAGYQADDVHAKARLEGRNVAVEGRANAYGASATASGHLVLPENTEPLAVDLRGRARHVDLRRLPRDVSAPRAATDVNAAYRLSTSVAARTGTEHGKAGLQRTTIDLEFEPSTVAGGRVEGGSTASVAVNGADVQYQTDATVAGVDLQQLGEQFNIPALATDRFKSSLNGHITASGRGTTPNALDLTARGTLTDSSVLGGHVGAMTFDASVNGDTTHVKAAGDFDGVNPAALTDKPELEGRVAGTLDVDATLARTSEGVTPDSVQATGTVSLQPSTIGKLDITRATIDGDYHNATADIRAFDAVGRDVNVHASGTVALGESGASNLTVHADTSNLEAVGQLVDQPLAGIGAVDAKVTGNRRELRIAGHATGDGIKYGENGALALSSDFTATVPELSAADATVAADSHATFVTIAGQNINEITGKTEYAQKQLTFDLTAKQPQRSLTAGGSVVLHPDHQEAHVEKLALQTAGMTWQLAAGAAPTINYAHGDVAVTEAKLVSGDQTIALDGAFGKPSEALRVTFDNVDVAAVDALLLRPPQLSGRLNATATVRAAADTADSVPELKRIPQVDTDFQITKGGFRQFHYDTFGGTVHYRGKGLTVDTKLEQSPGVYLTAKGYLPTAVFTPASDEERAAAHAGSVAPEDRVDLHVESTPIDLGLVQGFTTELTNVSGTLQANVDVTGPAADPHPIGVITLVKGAFTVTATGVPYNTVEGKVELQPDRVHVGAISALDNHFNPITISGDLPLHEGQIGDVQVYVHSDDFKVIDNKMGNLRVNTDLRIAGDLRAPRLEGDLGVTTGAINLDPVLAQVAESPYAVAPTEYATPPAPANAKVPDAVSLMAAALNGLSTDVHITVPDDLVVKSADLQAPGSPVGLGALVVTLGGDLRATKAPGGQIALVGVVNTVRGSYTFQGRRFDIMRDGFVRFTGEPVTDMDPELDIRTRRLIQAVEARVNVRGTLKQPEIVLASTPPLENADILSLIVFNQPVNQLGETQQLSLIQQAQYLAGGALTSELSQSIASALNLNEFDINLAPESGTGAQIRIGQQVGPNLFVRLEQGVGDQSQTNLIVEYELQKWLRLQTNYVQGASTQQQLFQRMQGSGVNLLFFFSY